MGKKYIIGIDAGTSRIKSVLFDEAGTELCIADEKVELLSPAPGLAEQDMNTVWNSVFQSLKTLLDRVDIDTKDVLAIAITGQADGVWLVGEDGEPVCNSYNWTDSRALGK